MKSITISIPAYNDETTIVQLIEESKDVLSQITDDYEIVVINDGSKDRTFELLEKIKSEKIKVFHHSVNKGFGETIKEVFTLPTKEWIFFIPGDAQVLPQEINKLLRFCDSVDFILGLRTNRQDSILRKVLSFCYNGLISIIGMSRIHDVNSVALLRKEVLKDISINSKSAFVHAEIYLKLLRKGYKIKEVEIKHNPRVTGKSGAVKVKVFLTLIKDLLLHFMGEL